MTGFYTHRKTVKLRSKIGNDALWVPPRLWAYAAENQPDGNLAGYSSEEIAELIGCPKYAKSILQALKECRFVDENGIIHDWEVHNGYHEKFSIRAKKAAVARWSKSPPLTPLKQEIGNGKVESGDKHCLTNACSIQPTLEMAKKWLTDWKNSGADYSQQEMESAFLALQANGWMWGRNPVADPRAALERQIQTDRQRSGKSSSNGKHPHWPPRREVELYAKEKDDDKGYWVSWYEFWSKKDFKRGENLIDWKVELAASIAKRR